MSGVHSNASQLVAKFRSVQTTLPDSVRQGAGAAGMAVKQEWLGIAGTNGVAPGGLIARRRWGVGYTVLGGANATTLVAFRGPVHLVFGPTQAHPIRPKKRNGKRAVLVGGEPFAVVNHPGTAGKPAVWPACKKAAEDMGSKVYAAESRKALVQAGLGHASSLGALK